jgi:hypothetical protein
MYLSATPHPVVERWHVKAIIVRIDIGSKEDPSPNQKA